MSLDGKWHISAGASEFAGDFCLTITQSQVTSWLRGCSTPVVIATVAPGSSTALTATITGRDVLVLVYLPDLTTTEGHPTSGLASMIGTLQDDGSIAGTLWIDNAEADLHLEAAFLMEQE